MGCSDRFGDASMEILAKAEEAFSHPEAQNIALEAKKAFEQKQINPEALTQGMKADAGKPRVGLIPPKIIEMIAAQYTMGADKYVQYNWALGMNYERVYSALQRHVLAWWGGERYDPIDNVDHLVAVIWNAMTLLHYELDPERYKQFDDRPHTMTPERIMEFIAEKAKENEA